MATPFRGIHPKKGHVFHRSQFVAYGKGKASADVTGTVLDRSGKTVGTVLPVVGSQQVWALWVRGIPNGRYYKLKILNAASGSLLGEVDELTVEPKEHLTGIDHPKDGDLPVDVNFLVYGPTTETTALTPSLDPEDNEQITQLFGPPGNLGYYCFEYDQVDPGHYDPGVHVEGSSSSADQVVDVQRM
jgi:hypothetical protein